MSRSYEEVTLVVVASEKVVAAIAAILEKHPEASFSYDEEDPAVIAAREAWQSDST